MTKDWAEQKAMFSPLQDSDLFWNHTWQRTQWGTLRVYCKSLKFCVGFILRMICFRECKYHTNILVVHCNNVTNSKSANLNCNEITFMGKPQNIIPMKYKPFTVINFKNLCAYVVHIYSIVHKDFSS